MTAAVMPGAEPFSSDGGSAGVLVLHGFTGNPQSMRPLADALSAAGFSVELPLLAGHGTSVEDMVQTRWSDYVRSAEDALEELSSRTSGVAIAALSMGGTLACWLAEHRRAIRGLALVNPFVDPPAQSFRDVLRGVLESGSELAPGVGSDIAKGGSVELAYEHTPVAAALSLFEGIDEVSADLAKVTCPVLLMSSRQDHVVPSSSGDLLSKGVSGPLERVWLERSYHVATLDHDAAEIEALIVAFMRRVLADSGAADQAADQASDRKAGKAG